MVKLLKWIGEYIVIQVKSGPLPLHSFLFEKYLQGYPHPVQPFYFQSSEDCYLQLFILTGEVFRIICIEFSFG